MDSSGPCKADERMGREVILRSHEAGVPFTIALNTPTESVDQWKVEYHPLPD